MLHKKEDEGKPRLLYNPNTNATNFSVIYRFGLYDFGGESGI